MLKFVARELFCHLNYFSAAVPFGVIKELMCSEKRGHIQGTNFFIPELILVMGKKKEKKRQNEAL